MNVPNYIKNNRAALCAQCPKPCENQKNDSFHSNPESECPIKWAGRWHKSRLGEKMKGAGDLVAKIAKPIARAADAILKTNLTNCVPCQARRNKLNEKLPFSGK
jgi:hypothetical protein